MPTRNSLNRTGEYPSLENRLQELVERKSEHKLRGDLGGRLDLI